MVRRGTTLLDTTWQGEKTFLLPAGEVGVGGHVPLQRRLAHRAQHVRQGLPWGEGKLLETSEVMWIRHCGKILQTIAIKELFQTWKPVA